LNAHLQQHEVRSPETTAPPRERRLERAAELREYIHEMCGLAAHYAALAQGHAEVADDRGLEFDLRKVIAHIRAARDTYNDLVAAGRQLEGDE
jgi:hypothetical protein